MRFKQHTKQNIKCIIFTFLNTDKETCRIYFAWLEHVGTNLFRNAQAFYFYNLKNEYEF